MIPPLDIRDPLKGTLYFVRKTLPPLTAQTHQLYLRTQGSVSKKTICPPDCWDPPATSSHTRKCLTVGTHLVEAYVALSFWSRTCTYILVDVEARTCRSRGAHVACTRTYNGQGARKKIWTRTYIRAGSRTPTCAYVHGWVGTEKHYRRRVHGEPTGWVGTECVIVFIGRAWTE